MICPTCGNTTVDQPMMTATERKTLYKTYRATAKKLYENGKLSDLSYDKSQISVTLNSSVTILDRGAFVQAVIWIPKEDLLEFTPEELQTSVPY